MVTGEKYMITKYNFYDSVPVGVAEFSEFFKTIQSTLDSVLLFSFSNTTGLSFSEAGGFVESNPVKVVQFTNSNGKNMFVLSGVEKDGIIFTKSGSFFSEVVPVVTDLASLNIIEWTLLASSGAYIPNQKDLIYSTNLPYRIAYANGTHLDFGAYEYRYNGVPQRDSAVRSILDDTGKVIEIRASAFTFGAEYPHPILNKKYVNTSVGMTLSDYIRIFGSSTNGEGYFDLKFSYTNFSVEGSQIILRRLISGNPFYIYLPQDFSGGFGVKENTYKIIDKARGILRIKLTSSFLSQFKSSAETDSQVDFEIIAPELLVEELNNGVISYKSRYGSVFSGTTNNIELLSLNQVLGEYILQRVPVEKINSSNSEIIFSERFANSSDMVLAVRYSGIAEVQEEKQKAKYYPDVISLFFTAAVQDNLPGDVIAAVDINKTSWYNWDVSSREYKPVNRLEKAYLKLVSPRDGVAGFNPVNPILKFAAGKAEFTYVYPSKTTLGTRDEFVRRDAAIPEPQHINPIAIKTVLAQDETLTVNVNEQMVLRKNYTVNGNLIVNGDFFVD